MKNMNLILGGNSLKNRKWTSDLASIVSNENNEFKPYEYKHWKENNQNLNFKIEESNLYEIINDGSIIIAKSAGIILALMLIKNKKIKPSKCIFIGTPFSWALKENINLIKLLQGLEIKTLFIQNLHDPAIGANELIEKLKNLKLKNYELVKLPGETHSYDDLDSLGKIIYRFLIYI